jgi:hypothetical protein
MLKKFRVQGLMCSRVNALYGDSLFKIIIFHKSPCFSVKLLIFFGTIGSMIIKSMYYKQ